MVDGADNGQGTGGREAPVPEPTPPKAVDPADRACGGAGEGAGAGGGAPLPAMRRCAGAGARRQRFVRLAGDGSYLRLNESGSVVMDALDGGTLADAASALRERYDIDEERAREDAVTATRELLSRRVVLAATAPAPSRRSRGRRDLPGLEPSG